MRLFLIASIVLLLFVFRFKVFTIHAPAQQEQLVSIFLLNATCKNRLSLIVQKPFLVWYAVFTIGTFIFGLFNLYSRHYLNTNSLITSLLTLPFSGRELIKSSIFFSATASPIAVLSAISIIILHT